MDLSLPKTSSGVTECDSCASGGAMFALLIKILLVVRSRLKSRARLEAENIVLRQQVIVLNRKSPSRVRLRNIDRLIFVWMYRLFPSILAITVVVPQNFIRAHGNARDRPGRANAVDFESRKRRRDALFLSLCLANC